ncbi:MAG: hypothetical protein JNN30_01735 [Rhodanobacteraceae bacterium]|nr:hypothetical protein [Rhodanobacteraceae bacterium]
MPSFPKIDTPCPLRWKRAPTKGGDYCSTCQRHVLNLDTLNDAQRRALVAGCATDICVSYTVTRRRLATAGLGLATALGINLAAAEVAPDRSPVEAQSLIPSEVRADCATDEKEAPELVEVLVGGIRSPHDAEWVEVSSLPDLPFADSNVFHDATEFVAPTAAQAD